MNAPKPKDEQLTLKGMCLHCFLGKMVNAWNSANHTDDGQAPSLPAAVTRVLQVLAEVIADGPEPIRAVLIEEVREKVATWVFDAIAQRAGAARGSEHRH